MVLNYKNLFRKFMEQMHESIKLGEEWDGKSVQEQMEHVTREIEGLTRVKFEDLLQLKAKSEQLRNVLQHIQQLSQEGEQIQRDIDLLAFNLMEKDQIIVCYEKDIRDKEALLAQMKQQAREKERKIDDMNFQISDLLEQIMKFVDEIKLIKLQIQETTKKLNNEKDNFEKTQKIVEDLKKNYFSIQGTFRREQNENQVLTEKITKLNQAYQQQNEKKQLTREVQQLELKYVEGIRREAKLQFEQDFLRATRQKLQI